MQKYTASVITAGCLWGLMGLFTRTLATYGVDSTGAIVLRCGIAALLFAVTLLVRAPKQFRIRLKDIWCFIGTGICSLLFFTYCYFQAITIMAKLGGRSGTPVSSSNGSWNSRHGTMPK